MGPLASVVIPARDAASTIGDQLAALSRQRTDTTWEVVVADNGSRDETIDRVMAWSSLLPSITIVDASGRPGIAHARNVGVGAARGTLILMCDADDVVAPDWLAAMLGALADHPFVTGPIESSVLNRPVAWSWMQDPSAAARGPRRVFGHEPFAAGGNVGMHRSIFDAVGGFDSALRRGEDIDFSWKAAALGHVVHFEPAALVHYRLRSAWAPTVVQGATDGYSTPLLWRRWRRLGMEREGPKEVFAVYDHLLRQVPQMLRRRELRYGWAYESGCRLGRVVGSLRHRSLFL